MNGFVSVVVNKVEEVELICPEVVVDEEDVVDEVVFTTRVVVVDVIIVVVDLATHEKPPSVFMQF